MKVVKVIALGLTLFSFAGNTIAQDDFYPSTTKKSKKVVEIIVPEETVSEDEYDTATDYYINNKDWQIGEQFFYYIAGDLFGAFIVFYCLKFLNNYLKYYYRNNN